MGKLARRRGELTRTLTDEEAGELRRELLPLMAPFPPTRDKTKDNTLAALTLLRELPDSEVRKITNGDGGSFIKALEAALVAEQAGPGGGQKQPVAFDYFDTCSKQPAEELTLPDLEKLTWGEVETEVSGAAFNCAETTWQQWLRFPRPVSIFCRPRTSSTGRGRRWSTRSKTRSTARLSTVGPWASCRCARASR